jgi:hypothetical protein
MTLNSVFSVISLPIFFPLLFCSKPACILTISSIRIKDTPLRYVSAENNETFNFAVLFSILAILTKGKVSV